jgi:PAS domain S-box-containing protein
MDKEKRQAILYTLLFESATEGILIANKTGEIEIANHRTAELFGYSNEELLEVNVDDLLPKHLRQKHKEHRKKYTSQPHKRAMGQGYDLIGVRKDGTSFPIEISLNYYQVEGNTKVMALIMDVTIRKEQEAQIKMLNSNLEQKVKQRTKELRESQQLYSIIARNFPNGTINVLDKNLNYIFVEGEELFRYGITSDNLMGKNYIERLPAALKDTIRKNLENVFLGNNQSFEIKHQNEHYLINTVGLLDSENNISRLLLVEQNITQRKVAEEQTKDALTKEKQLNELKSRFVSLASHEFRTPLSTVLSSLSLIEKYDELDNTEKKLKHYKRIRSSVRHLTSILNDFLSLEKVEAGKVYVSINQFNMKALLDELIDQNREIAKNGQVIKYTFSGSEMIGTDQNMVRIIVTNLLSNAIKYSTEGRPIEVIAELNEELLKLTVIDKGIGIPEDEQENLFERFFRAKNAINLEGTGLGLNIVSKYLQLLEGSVSFKSVSNEGTTFFIEIPNQHTT